LLFLLSFFYSFCVLAKSNFNEEIFQELNIEKVEVNCHQHYKCKSMQKKWDMLQGKYLNLDELKESIRLMIYESGIMDFHYSISKDEKLDSNDEVRHRLIIDFLMRPVLDEISLRTEQKIDLEYLKSLLSLKEKSFFYEDKIPDSIQIIKRYLEESGFLDPEIEYRVNKIDDENQKIIFDIKIGTKTEISSVFVDTKNPKLKRIIESDINSLLGKPRDLILIQERISQLKEQLFQLGYYFAHLDTQFESFKTDDVLKFKLKIILIEGEHFSSVFSGNRSFSVQDLRSTIVDGMKKGQKTFNINFLKNELKDKYSKIGLMNTFIDVEQRPSASGQNIFVFKITEGHRIKIKEVGFIGNSFKSQSILYEIFKEQPSPLIANGFYDEAYVESFSDKLRNEYVKDGYIFVEVDGPFLKFNKKQTKVSIQYRVREGSQTELTEIQLQQAPEYLKEGIFSLMNNKVGHPLNVLEINDDMKNANTYLKEQGYYFSKIKNESSGTNSILRYNNHYKSAKLIMNIETGSYVYLSNIIITGNTKTKENIILREINLYKNNVITPEDMKRIKMSLSPWVYSRCESLFIPDF
jgi:outer membrane protein insertion porin family